MLTSQLKFLSFDLSIIILGGENDEDMSFTVYYLSDNNKWETKDEMVSDTMTSLDSYFSVLNLDIDCA